MNVSTHIGLMVRAAGTKRVRAPFATRVLSHAAESIVIPVQQAVDLAQESIEPALGDEVARR